MKALSSRQQRRDHEGANAGGSDAAATAAEEKASILLHAAARLQNELERARSGKGAAATDTGAAVAAPPLEPSVDQLAGDQDSLLAA